MQQPNQKSSTPSSPATPTSPISLARCQSQHTVLRRGSVIGLASGAVLVIYRTPLESSVLTVHVPLHAGGVYWVAVPGVYEIRALKDARLHLVPVASWQPLRGLQAAFKALAGKLLSEAQVKAQGLLAPRPARALSRPY